MDTVQVSSQQINHLALVSFLNLPVWNGLFSCPVLLLRTYFRIIPCHILDVMCRASYKQSIVQSELENVASILPGLTAVKIFTF